MKAIFSPMVCLLACCSAAPQDAEQIKAAIAARAGAGLQAPTLMAVSTVTGRAATLRPVGQNDDVKTWQSRDGVQLSIRDGVIVGTRGLGFDVVEVDEEDRADHVRAGQGHYVRRWAVPDGNFGLRYLEQMCEVTAATALRHDGVLYSTRIVRHNEICRNEDGAVENHFDISSDGTVWASKQWIGPEVGYLEVEVLNP